MTRVVLRSSHCASRRKKHSATISIFANSMTASWRTARFRSRLYEHTSNAGSNNRSPLNSDSHLLSGIWNSDSHLLGFATSNQHLADCERIARFRPDDQCGCVCGSNQACRLESPHQDKIASHRRACWWLRYRLIRQLQHQDCCEHWTTANLQD